MLVGKRPRPPIMRRTRSMSGGMAIDTQTQQATTEATTNNLEVHEEVVMSDSLHPHLHDEDAINSKDPHAVVMGTHDDGFGHTKKNVIGDKGYEYDECLAGTVMFPSPTTTIANNHPLNQTSNNNPAHAIHSTSHFLRTCGLCRCRLAPGRDIYMYRGDTAFCSLECREKQMKQDQRKEKRKAINKEKHRVSPPPTAKVSTKSETAAAACT